MPDHHWVKRTHLGEMTRWDGDMYKNRWGEIMEQIHLSRGYTLHIVMDENRLFGSYLTHFFK